MSRNLTQPEDIGLALMKMTGNNIKDGFVKITSHLGSYKVEQMDCLQFFKIEHSQAAHRLDFAMYAITAVSVAAFLLADVPRGQRLEAMAFALAGLAGWTAIEYVLHRFVLHGLQPFKRLHAEHHLRPTALIFTPTILSATAITALVFIPALLAAGLWRACALTLGVLTGYLAYTITHHAIHHWRSDNAWLKQRKRWHALHHHCIEQPGYYGVTSAFWDHVFGSNCRTVTPKTVAKDSHVYRISP